MSLLRVFSTLPSLPIEPAKRLKNFILPAFLALLGSAAFGAAGDRVVLPHSIRQIVAANTLKVEALKEENLAEKIQFHVALKMRNHDELAARVAAGEKISFQELQEKYLPTQAAYNAVLKWAASQHLSVTRNDTSKLGVFVAGTVAQVKTALQVDFEKVTVEDGTYISATTAPSLPTNLALSVLSINGLQPHVHPKRMSTQPQPLLNFKTPYYINDIKSAYNANNLGFDGTGERIAILIDTFPLNTDLTTFWSVNGIPQSLSNIEKVRVVPAVTYPAPSGEETLDVEWSSGIAPGAKVRIYGTSDLSFVNLDAGLEQIITDIGNGISIDQLSISLGSPEDLYEGQDASDDNYYLSLAGLGVTIFVSSGDDGSSSWASPPFPPGAGTTVSFPASDPNVTGVGGTSLTLNSSGSSAGTIKTETAWSGSGGGYSAGFTPRPAWQIVSGTGAFPAARLVPDVAAVADPNTPAYLYLNGVATAVGGTSWSSPTWAGFAAVINQARRVSGTTTLGFLNTALYLTGTTLISGTVSFHDITSGANGAYSASAGYDMVTGLGTPDVSRLAVLLGGVPRTTPSIFSVTPQNAPQYTFQNPAPVVTISGANLSTAYSVSFTGSDNVPHTSGTILVSSPSLMTATVPSGTVTGTNLVTVKTLVGSGTGTVNVVPPVLGDIFGSGTNQGILLSGTIPGLPSGTYVGTNIGATKQANEPNDAGNIGGASVWFNWTAPSNGTYNFNTFGSSFDTLLSVYQGGSIGSLQLIASNDDAGLGVTSSVTFNAVSAAMYRIQIDGFNPEQGINVSEGTYYLNWSKLTAGPTITSFTPTSGQFGNTVNVTGSNFFDVVSVQFNGTPTTLFTVTSTTGTSLSVIVPQGASTGLISLTGTVGGTGFSSSNFTVTATPPNSNDMLANAQPLFGSTGTVTGNNTAATVEYPAGTIDPGGIPSIEPTINGNYASGSIWYAWTAPANGVYTFNTLGSNFATLLAIYQTGTSYLTGTSYVNQGQQIAAADKISNGILQSRVSFSGTKGTIYYVSVDGYGGGSDGSGGQTGSVTLSWLKNTSSPAITSFTPEYGSPGAVITINGSGFLGAQNVYFTYNIPSSFTVISDSQITAIVPASASNGSIEVVTPLGTAISVDSFTVASAPGNDNFANSFPINGPPYNVGLPVDPNATNFNGNLYATKETGEPNHAGNAGGHSVWWNWTPTVSGTYVVTTEGSSFDTLLAVYTGSSILSGTVSGLTLVASNDDVNSGLTTSQLSFVASSSTNYKIAVDGKNGAGGSVFLSVLPQGPPIMTLFATGFETTESFDRNLQLTGQGGFINEGSGANGLQIVVSGTTAQQQAYIGGSIPPRTPDTDLEIWRPINFTPSLSYPIVTFTVDMTVNGNGDSFEWRVFNQSAHELFGLSFNSYDTGIYYQIDGNSSLVYSGQTFVNGHPYTGSGNNLVITMDYIHNLWSATLANTPIVTNLPITSTKAALNLGHVDAAWENPFGGQMLFDNFSLVALSDLRPQITSPTQVSVNSVPQPWLTGTANLGDTVTMTAAATGGTPLSYQWNLSGTAITTNTTATTSTLILNPLTANEGGTYTLQISNQWGNVTASPVNLTAFNTGGSPIITSTAQNVTVVPGGTATFNVSAIGSPPLAYQWQFVTLSSTTTITSATTPTLALTNVTGSNAGSYVVTVSNGIGSPATQTDTLTIGLPFASLVGSYTGIILPVSSANLSGSVKIQVSKTGSFSGSVTIAGKTFSIKGVFDTTGFWKGFVGFDAYGNPVQVTLNLSLIAGGDQITGTVTDDGSSPSTFTANRALYSGTNKALEAGSYTMLMPPVLTGSSYPQGTGYGVVTVDTLGNARITGKLGDGTAISTASVLSKTGAWPIFFKTNKGPGAVYGTLQFALSGTTSTGFAGTLQWTKPSISTDAFYPGGFTFSGTNAVVATGSKYVKPLTGQTVIPFSGSPTVLISNGNLASPLTEHIAVSTKNVVTGGSNSFKMTITTSSGLFTGSFVPGAVALPAYPTKSLTFGGVILQSGTTGGGVFQGASPLKGQSQSGSIQLNP